MARVSAANRDEYLQVKREIVLDAAYKTFLSEGFEKTSIDKIARAANIGKGSVYLYFKSKEELFITLMEEKSFLPKLKEIAVQPDGTLEEKLRVIANGYLDFIESAMPFLKMSLAGAFEFPELTRKVYHELSTLGIRYLEKIFTRHYPELKNIMNISVISTLFISSLFVYVLTQRFLEGSKINPISREEWVNEVVNLFMARIQTN
ncbi:MAG: TetR/AcrR family transcriptional regulator [Anaerolineaceae bacterium]|nr:TetR/AcrR family transcriptional regulator [Anaerolineaceae bacterium]